MNCAACGATSPPGKRFCGDCGAALAQTCSSCGAVIETGKRFCGDCGAPLTGAAASPDAPAQDPAPVAERRLCSVLFLDLVGFTTVAEGRDPEDVRELLGRYFEVASTVVGRFGGVVEKFIGDAVMAVWGTPVATELDAERAVRAALDLVEAVHALGIELDADGLAARAGVLTGEVAVTLGATNEAMVAGDAVNTAARIQAVAAPGAVFVDATTRRLTSSAIAYRAEGAHELKGKSEPEPLWRATRIVSAVGGSMRVDGLEAPLTGRGAEMRAIREMFHAAAERRQPRMLMISGVAGVGKSRLGWEFEKYIDGLADVVLWHRGRCLSYGDGLVYWALAEAVRQRLGIAEEDPPDLVARRLSEGLEKWVHDPDDRQFIGLRIARLLGASFAGDNGATLGRDELFAGWRRFVEQLAAFAPVLILVEDAHHAAPDLLDFLDHLIDWARDLPIFVLVFARPEIEQRRPGFAAGRNRATIALDPLDPAAMDALVDSLVPDAAAGARQAIVERAEGIPLYAVESIRALIDRDVIQPVDGVYRLVGELDDVGDLAVPDSLHALLAARLDALDATARRVVADCAVLGTSFPPEAVGAVSGMEPDVVAEVLAELLRREVLEVSADPLSPERGNYRFAQEMLRQVAYDTMSRRDRKVRHLAVAAHLRSTFPNDGEEVIDAVARHYMDALDAVPDDTDTAEVRDLAVSALVRAGERALRSGSPDRAGSSYTTAGDLAAASGDPLRAAGLWLEATEALTSVGGGEAMQELARRARAVYLEHGDAERAAEALLWEARGVHVLGHYTEAHPLFERALAELGPGPSLVRLEGLRFLSMHTLVMGDGQKANDIAEEALQLAHALAVDDRTYARLLYVSGTTFDAYGDRRRGSMYLQESVRLAERSGSRSVLADVLGNLSNVLLVDEPAAAIDAAERALAIVQELGVRTNGGTLLANIALGNLAVGAWDAAVAAVDRRLDEWAFMDIGFCRLTLALARGLRGEPSDDLIADTLGRINHEDPQDMAALGSARAFSAVARGEHEEALDHALRVVELIMGNSWLSFGGDDGRWTWPLAARLAHELARFDVEADLLACFDTQPAGAPARMQRAEAELIRARLADSRGETGAGDLYATALDLLRADSTPYHLAHGLLDQADHLRRSGDGRADELVAEARALGERLGCAPVMVRADASGPAVTSSPS